MPVRDTVLKKMSEQDISDKWIYFLRNANEYENPPQQLQKTQALMKAFNVLERGRWTKQELEVYEKIVDARRVEKSKMKTARAMGMQEGLEKGLVKGAAEGVAKVARKMLSQNLSIEFICETTGLTEQEVQALKADK